MTVRRRRARPSTTGPSTAGRGPRRGPGGRVGRAGAPSTGQRRARPEAARGRALTRRWPTALRVAPAGDTDGDPDARALTAEAGAATRIGITGHSDLTTPSLPIVADALRAWLTTQVTPPWVGVSCLAGGADRLFAGLALELGGGLEVILPARDYRARKVGPNDAAEFDRLLAAATSVTVLGHDRSCREAHMAAGEALLHAVDIMVAVWDGHPAHRHGSTGDVVAAARQLELPLVVLWPTGAARHPSPARTGSQVLLVLAGLVFPAQRWEIVMFAEYYGADRFTRQRLAGLPEGRYHDMAAVTAALAAPRHDAPDRDTTVDG